MYFLPFLFRNISAGARVPFPPPYYYQLVMILSLIELEFVCFFLYFCLRNKMVWLLCKILATLVLRTPASGTVHRILEGLQNLDMNYEVIVLVPILAIHMWWLFLNFCL
jgi:hypothetical protein